MKYVNSVLFFVLISFLTFAYVQNTQKSFTDPIKRLTTKKSTPSPDNPQTTVIAEGLDTPWGIAFLPDNTFLVTERPGTVRLLDAEKKLHLVATIENVKEIGEGGLLGITVHPHFSTNHYVYLYYTYTSNGANTLNRVVRMTYINKKLSDEVIIVDAIPGASNHNGGRIKFGPDSLLYITTGDAENPSQAQDKNALAGKILRVTDEGKPAPGNPFNNRTYSYGHRNPQGIAWDTNGQLWSTEHGPSGVETGNDEINMIQIGKNYGWPDIRGTQTKTGMETPVIESGFGNAWAPASMTYFDGIFYFSGLKGQSLFAFDPSTKNLQQFFKGEYGRVREVIAGPDGMLYITTSNKDGRGVPKENDDKIIQVLYKKF